MKVTCYTDGSCLGNPGPGGWAVMLRTEAGGRLLEKTISGGAQNATNNQMELKAVVEAVRALKRPCTMILHSDSAYVVNNYTRVPLWRAKGWHTTTGEVKNRKLWEELESLVRAKGVDLRFVKVAGHAGLADNESMDALAKLEAMKYNK